MSPTRREIRYAVLRLRGKPIGIGLTEEQAKQIINSVDDKALLDAGFYAVKEIRRLANG